MEASEFDMGIANRKGIFIPQILARIVELSSTKDGISQRVLQ